MGTRPAGRTAAIAAACTLALAACGSGPTGSLSTPDQQTLRSDAAAAVPGGPLVAAPARSAPSVRVDRVVATGLAVPWGLARLPDRSLLVAERTGRVVRISGSGRATAVGRVPGVRAAGEGGLLGLAVAASAPGAVFAYLTSTGDNRVLRIPWSGGRLQTSRARVLIKGIPAAGRHNGGRIVVGPDGNLWIGTGDAGRTANSQNRSSLGGKILRISLSGKVPSGNPFSGSPVWSLGHRNVQGLAFDADGRLWATEFGQDTWDELNLITKGGNHGWPRVEGRGNRSGYVDPKVVWRTSDASPSGLAIVGGVAYVAALRGERLWQVPISSGGSGSPVARLRGTYGRLRTVEPDGAGGLWLTTSNRDGRGRPARNDDRVLHLRVG